MPAAVEIRQISAADTYPLRHQVLWPDKPLAYVHVPDDAEGHHFGAYDGNELVSVVSLFVRGREARFRKFATRPDRQGQGIGSALLRHLMAEAARLGARELWCDARQEAAGFYQKFGFAGEGATFYKGTIPYVRMRCALPQPAA
ncbi:GNAT family N-acetyltransferase [Hymenobacter latericus]|uniref:GNAT family N-acetyltransferase n=1 Tax=Hymenobacter sp. YIM 151858-1 TaxID=2987688 RepID=UPI002226EFA7|nr:GNAT family N-acetyltransferase [Hymenobacter sp. YIM 151858-1]UYZ59009.1 GNAT family N-acetyltransferase [Hymenobacter sp. YIM 151858-1]